MLRGFVVAFSLIALGAPGAHASLKTYQVNVTNITSTPDASPNPTWSRQSNIPPGSRPQDGTLLIEKGSRAVIDDTNPGSPVLKTLQVTFDNTVTGVVPQLGGFVFISESGRRGPSGEFTGAGSTAGSIAWGLVTGWSVTGLAWCHSSPAFICGLLNRVDLETIRLPQQSPFYDLGTWTFHGTGFTATPFVIIRPEPGKSNVQTVYRGPLLFHGTVPALPLLGIALLGGSLLVGASTALRRRRN